MYEITVFLYDNPMSNNFPIMAVKLFLKDRLQNVFKSYIFFLGKKDIKIAVANCKTSFMRDQSSGNMQCTLGLI